MVTKDPWYEKMVSQVEQAKARGGNVIAVATDGDEQIGKLADKVLWVPEAPWMLIQSSDATAMSHFICTEYEYVCVRSTDREGHDDGETDRGALLRSCSSDYQIYLRNGVSS